GVNVIGILCEDSTEQLALGAFVSRLEAAQQFVKRAENLLRELFRNRALVIAAALEQRRQPASARSRDKTPLVQQHVQRREDRTARHFGHVSNVESDIAGVFAMRRVKETDLRSVAQ